MGMPNNGKIPVDIQVGLNTEAVFNQLDAIEKKIQGLDFDIKTAKGEQALNKVINSINTLQNNLNSINTEKLTQALAPIQTLVNGLGGQNGANALKTLTELSRSLEKLTPGTNNNSKKSPYDSIVSDYEKAIKRVADLQKKNMSGKQTTSFTNQLRQAMAEEERLAKQYQKLVKEFGESPTILDALGRKEASKNDIYESNALKQVEQELKNLGNAEKQAAEISKQSAETRYKAVKKVSDAYKEVEQNASNYYRLQMKSDLGKKLTAQERYQLNTSKPLFTDYKNQTGVFDTSKYNALPIDYQNRQKAALKAEFDAQISAMTAEVDAYTARLESFKNRSGEFKSESPFTDQLKEVQTYATQLDNYLKQAFDTGTVEGKEFVKVLSDANKSIQKLEVEAKDTGNKLAGMFNVTTSQQNVESFFANNTKYFNAHRKEAAELQAKANALNKESSLADVDAVNTLLNQRKAEANALGQNGLSFLSKMDKSIGYAVGGTVAALTTVNLAGKINEAVQASNQLNASMIELSKVSDSTMSNLNAQFDDFANISKDIGGTINDTIKATADWSRNGYSLPDSKELARVSQLYKNIGDNITIDEANTSLISTMQGYKMQASEAEHIVDVLNEVSNNEATSSAGLGEALQRSAASFEVANTSLEKSVALITAANSVVQDPSRVGNMWKTKNCLNVQKCA